MENLAENLDYIPEAQSVVDNLSATNFLDVQNSILLQVSNICNSDPYFGLKRNEILTKNSDGNYSDEESFSKISSLIFLYGATGINGYQEINKREALENIRNGDFYIFEKLLLSKGQELKSVSDPTEKIKLYSEISDLIYGATQSLYIISHNPSRATDINRATRKINIFISQLDKYIDNYKECKLSEGGEQLQYSIGELQYELGIYNSYLQVMYDSHIQSKSDDTEVLNNQYNQRKRKIYALLEKLYLVDNIDNGENKELEVLYKQYVNQLQILDIRCNLEENQDLKNMYYGNENSDINIIKLQNQHRDLVYRLIKSYCGIASIDINNVCIEGSEGGEKLKGDISSIINHFLSELELNSPKIKQYYDIIELIFTYTDFFDEKICGEFYDKINQLKDKNKRFNNGDLNLFVSVLQSKVRYKIKFEKEKELSRTDGLTGISNTRNFNDLLIDSIERSSRFHHYVGLMIMDVDKFKSINDTYGHVAGDEVLSILSRVIMNNIRSGDSISRIGGEEFALIFETADENKAKEFSEKIRSVIELEVTNEFREWGVENGLSMNHSITISGGVTEIKRDHHDYEILSNQLASNIKSKADSAMYESKNSGRNRITFSS